MKEIEVIDYEFTDELNAALKEFNEKINNITKKSKEKYPNSSCIQFNNLPMTRFIDNINVCVKLFVK